jgi:HK97 family phage prohead protease
MERRYFRTSGASAELRDGLNGPMIVGYGVVFNQDSENLGGFIEQIDPGAATKTIKEADVRALGNHDADWLLGRTKAGTLRLGADGQGVWYEIDVNEADPDGKRAIEKVRRGDMDGSSFAFECLRDEWDWDSKPARRRVLEFKMVDIGPVTWPAYPDSTAAARALDRVAAKTGHPVAELVGALGMGEIRKLIMDTEPIEEAEVETPVKQVSREVARSLRQLVIDAEARGDNDGGDPKNMEAMVGAVVKAWHSKLAESGTLPPDEGFTLVPLGDSDGDQDGEGQTLFAIYDETACWYVLADGKTASVVAYDKWDWDDCFRADEPETEDRAAERLAVHAHAIAVTTARVQQL